MGKHRKLRKIIVYLLILVLSAALLYVLEGSPSFTAEMAFRRKEKQNLVGPAEIIGTEELCCNYFNHMIVGASEYGYSTFVWYDETNWDRMGHLNYFPKQEDLTLFLPLQGDIVSGYDESWLPVMAFAEDSSAVRAQLTLELEYEGERNCYTVEATKSNGGYFLFRLEQDIISQASVARLLRVLSPSYVVDGTVTVTLSLYNRAGNLLNTYSPELITH